MVDARGGDYEAIVIGGGLGRRGVRGGGGLRCQNFFKTGYATYYRLIRTVYDKRCPVVEQFIQQMFDEDAVPLPFHFPDAGRANLLTNPAVDAACCQVQRVLVRLTEAEWSGART